jgi:hypothetical protein
MIWYTPCTGIWQTVWLESVPREHIKKLDLAAGADGSGMQTPGSSDIALLTLSQSTSPSTAALMVRPHMTSLFTN